MQLPYGLGAEDVLQTLFSLSRRVVEAIVTFNDIDRLVYGYQKQRRLWCDLGAVRQLPRQRKLPSRPTKTARGLSVCSAPQVLAPAGFLVLL